MNKNKRLTLIVGSAYTSVKTTPMAVVVPTKEPETNLKYVEPEETITIKEIINSSGGQVSNGIFGMDCEEVKTCGIEIPKQTFCKCNGRGKCKKCKGGF